MGSSTVKKRGKQARIRRSRNRKEAVRRLAQADSQLAQILPVDELDRLTEAAERTLASVSDEHRISSWTGEVLPSSEEMARIHRENLLDAFQVRRDLLQGALQSNEVADLLGVGRQTPYDRVRTESLIAIRENGRLLFPHWQFDPAGPDGVVPGLPEVLRAIQIPISPLAKISWFLKAKSNLSQRSPLQALMDGDIEAVIAQAQAIGAS